MTSWPSGVLASPLGVMAPVCFTADRELVYNARNAAGFYDAFVAGVSVTVPAGQDAQSHRGAFDIKGSRLLVTEARSAMMPMSEPGQGAGCDVVVYDLASGQRTELVSGRLGVIWPRWHPSQERIVWSEQTAAAWTVPPFGTQQIHTANVVDGELVDELVHAELPVGWYETYGWLDDQTLIFASDLGASWLQTDIYAMPDEAAGGETRTQLSTLGSYHEFAFLAPAGAFDDGAVSIVCGWCDGTFGLELWRIWLDGSGATQRLTFFHPWFGQGAGGLCFDPGDPKRIMLGVARFGVVDGFELTLP